MCYSLQEPEREKNEEILCCSLPARFILQCGHCSAKQCIEGGGYLYVSGCNEKKVHTGIIVHHRSKTYFSCILFPLPCCFTWMDFSVAVGDYTRARCKH